MPKNNVYKKNLSADEALKAIESYLSGTNHKIETFCVGVTVYVNLMYYDFKPRRVVRNEIEDIAPNIEVDEIRREFSDNAILLAYNDARDENQEIFIKMPNGSLQPTSIDIYLCERLSNKTITSNQVNNA